MLSALEQLDYLDATVLRFVYLSRLTTRQAAQRMGMPEQAVNARFARGMREFARIMTAE